MFPYGYIGHFHLYMHVSCKVIYTIITKFLYLKNNAISLIFKFWLRWKENFSLKWNYLLIHIHIYKCHCSHQTNSSFILVKFRSTFFAFQSTFQTVYLPWSASVDSLSNLSVLIPIDNSLVIVFLIYASFILRFDQHQGNVGADFQMRHFTVGVCSLKKSPNCSNSHI